MGTRVKAYKNGLPVLCESSGSLSGQSDSSEREDFLSGLVSVQDVSAVDDYRCS